MLSVTVTDHCMTVLATGEIDHRQWVQLVYAHGLQDCTIADVDYGIEDYGTDDPVHKWTLNFAPKRAEMSR